MWGGLQSRPAPIFCYVYFIYAITTWAIPTKTKAPVSKFRANATLPEDFDDSLKEDMIVQGKIKSVQPYGAFIELNNGVVGLLHIEHMSVA